MLLTDNGSTTVWNIVEPVIHVYGTFGGGALQIYTAPIDDDFRLTGATVAAGGTGYGNAQTFDVTLVGGLGIVAVVNVTSNAGGVITTVNSVTAAGSYKDKPANAIATVGGTGTGLTLNGTFSDNWTALAGGLLSANGIVRPVYPSPRKIKKPSAIRVKGTLSGASAPSLNVNVI